jgi:hypothetical protein
VGGATLAITGGAGSGGGGAPMAPAGMRRVTIAADPPAPAAPLPPPSCAPLELVLAAAAGVAPSLRTPLLLDLNDAGMAFVSERADELAQTAAVVRAPPPRPALVAGPALDPHDEVCACLRSCEILLQVRALLDGPTCVPASLQSA